MERLIYQGWEECVRLSNGTLDLILTTAVGPRIIHFGFVNGKNQFKEYETSFGMRGGEHWRMYGGHRLWHAPEDRVRTYIPDNTPISLEDHGDFVRTVQPVETLTGIQKEMDIRLGDGALAHITHRLRNTNLWPIACSAWALTVMAPAGIGILPLPTRASHEGNLLPSSTLALWNYTDLSDPRWVWGKNFILLRQSSMQTSPQKIGLWSPQGWIAYACAGDLFVKHSPPVIGLPYPDRGCNLESYTDAEMLELETLGPLTQIEPGQVVEHREDWYLFRDLPPIQTEIDVANHVLPCLPFIE